MKKQLKKLDAKIENLIRGEIKKLFKKDKSEWTLQHTLRVVYWMKKILEKEKGNERILIPAAYLHDIGYIETNVGKRKKMDKVYSRKFEHMKIGEKLCEKILSKFGTYFTKEEIARICKLVKTHDLPEFKKIKMSRELQLLWEADSLGAIDPTLKPTFSKGDIKKYLIHFKKIRAPLFKTKTGKRLLKKIYPQTLKNWLGTNQPKVIHELGL